jgi:hypothetical protein
MGSTGLYIKYLQLDVSGKLMANFDLVAIVPTPSTGTRIMYKKTGQTKLQVKDGKAAFTKDLSSFTTSVGFVSSDNITPDFPADAEVLLELNMGSVKLKAYMALVIDIKTTGDNSFTAQAGAYANAQTRVALFVFESMSATCDDNDLFSAAECKRVVSAAGTTESAINSCTPTAKCVQPGSYGTAKYLIIQVFEQPTFQTGVNGPSLRASNDKATTTTVNVYPIAKVSAYNGMFSLYVAPQLKVVVNAVVGGQASCPGGVEIEVDMRHCAKSIVHSLHCLGPNHHHAPNLRLGGHSIIVENLSHILYLGCLRSSEKNGHEGSKAFVNPHYYRAPHYHYVHVPHLRQGWKDHPRVRQADRRSIYSLVTHFGIIRKSDRRSACLHRNRNSFGRRERFPRRN